jgi:hypothetical protein
VMLISYGQEIRLLSSGNIRPGDHSQVMVRLPWTVVKHIQAVQGKSSSIVHFADREPKDMSHNMYIPGVKFPICM